MSKIVISLFLLCVYATAVELPDIEGRVLDVRTKKPIANVNIYFLDTGIGTSSAKYGAFKISVPYPRGTTILVFEHVAYDTLKVKIDPSSKITDFWLNPKLMQATEIEVEEDRIIPGISRDLPQPLTIIDNKVFNDRGYLDVGDVLVTEQSIRIDEEASGKKTITMRAGNADDVLILLDGAKLNSIYDNVFDLSLLNLEDVERIEIIKGSHTALYGPDAFSGVINIIPRFYKPYYAKFQQRFGTYNSADWNLQLNYNLQQKINFSYSFKKGNSYRNFVTDQTRQKTFENKVDNHSATVVYNFSSPDCTKIKEFRANYQHTSQDYKNLRWNEYLSDRYNVVLFKYSGNIYKFNNFNIFGTLHQQENKQGLNRELNVYHRDILSKRLNLHLEKTINYRWLDFLFAYQPEVTNLNIKNNREIFGEIEGGISEAEYYQYRNGLASIIKFHAVTPDPVINTLDVDISYRYDYIKNKNETLLWESAEYLNSTPEEKIWDESTLKFSTFLAGTSDPYMFNTFLNFGSNIKFPSLIQQLSTPNSMTENGADTQPRLEPERNFAFELNAEIKKELKNSGGIDSWQININYFRNDYENKFRIYQMPYNPLVFYDNIQTANISGWDLNGKLFFYNNRLILEAGTSNYAVSARAAFPFKYDFKNIINIQHEYAGYSIVGHFYREGEQVGVIRTADGRFKEISLPSYSNMDLHFSKSITFNRLKFIANLSARNLLNNDTIIEGIAIRDRRFYLTFGIQY